MRASKHYSPATSHTNSHFWSPGCALEQTALKCVQSTGRPVTLFLVKTPSADNSERPDGAFTIFVTQLCATYLSLFLAAWQTAQRRRRMRTGNVVARLIAADSVSIISYDCYGGYDGLRGRKFCLLKKATHCSQT